MSDANVFYTIPHEKIFDTSWIQIIKTLYPTFVGASTKAINKDTKEIFENVSFFSEPVNNFIEIINQIDTLTLTFDNISSVTLSPTPTENVQCHLWLDVGEGYEYQPNQDDFTPSDVILDGLTVLGKYLVYAYNPTTHENGYIEFEVT